LSRTPLAEHDKIEPFWVRPKKRRTAAPLVVPARDDPPAEPRVPAPPPPPDQPQEPSFPVSRQARSEAIAAIVSKALPPEPRELQADAPEARVEPSLSRAADEPRPEPGPDGWLQLSPVEAARHRLYGVRGFLILIGILIMVGLLRALIELIDFWATTDHGGLAAWIMAVLRSGMALWGALLLGLLLGCNRTFPTNFIAYAMVDVIYLTLFGLAFAHVTHNRVFIGVAAAIVVNLLAIAYVVYSRRVNVTFRHRIRVKRRREKPSAAPPSGVEASAA
jgi:hypothetical protein